MGKFGAGKVARCSFCGKSQEQVYKIIAGAGVYICDECTIMCLYILKDTALIDARIGAGLNDNIRYEWINGRPYIWTSQDIWHQTVTAQLWKRFDDFFNGQRCKAYIAPIDVRLRECRQKALLHPKTQAI